MRFTVVTANPPKPEGLPWANLLTLFTAVENLDEGGHMYFLIMD